MERYSNLKVYGNIKQVADQGTNEDDVLKVAGAAPLTSTPDTTSTGATPVYYKGQMAVVNGATSICSAITNDAGSSAPTSSTTWTYTWTPVGDPNGVSNPDGAVSGNVAVFSGNTGKVITDSGKTLNDGKLSIKGKNSTVIAEFTANQSSASSFEINAGTSLDITNDATNHKITINHNTAVSGGAGTIGSDSASSGATVAVPYATFDAQGHITGKGTHTHTIDSLAASTISSGELASARLPNATDSAKGAVTLVFATGESGVIAVPTEGKMEEFVNSSIGTNTANFKGTYDAESDLGLSETATTAQVVTALNAKTSWDIGGNPTNNDYCFVQFDLSQDPGNVDRYDRYKFSGTYGESGATWAYEYTLNNSSFTSEQWAAINSLVSNSTAGTADERSVDVRYIVTGPSSSTAAHIATFAGTAGNTIQDSGYTIETSVPSGAVFTDTKNTAGATDTSSKIYLIGATSQGDNPQTYSQDKVYAQSDKLYSNSIEVVNLSDSQALTNKTYDGLTLTAATTGFTIAGGTTSKTLTVPETYTLGAACEKGYTDSSSASAISTGTSLVTERDVYYGLPTINNSHDYTSGTAIYAPTDGGTSTYFLQANGSTSTPTWVSPATAFSNMGFAATDVTLTDM